MAKLDDDIDWHRNQIVRLHEAIARGEPGKPAVKGPAWGPKVRSDTLPDTMAGMRRLLEQLEQTLMDLEDGTCVANLRLGARHVQLVAGG